MTLLIAGLDDNKVWMVSDAAITGGNIPLRDREYEIKILPSLDGRALIGFAGDQHHGARVLRNAAESAAGQQLIDALLAEHLRYPSVDLAYGYVDHSKLRAPFLRPRFRF
jgi:ATP-dependent protease HslVU (ClpYQ) peptidase subunit